ncbi:hypothetical protein GOBAR_AA27609 [Gossypium barbadense]|uniref:Uncharacterized protein n=1 Tax=Gossypium barbadense TaxID=3634 RepID=A0A2P5WPP8_GOSBA|nr:hypothetical protein GOBAR_AA27609 [Gossypium barbadense]
MYQLPRKKHLDWNQEVVQLVQEFRPKFTPSLEHLILKSHNDKHSGKTPSKVSGPPLNPPSNPFGNAFYSVGSGLSRGGLGALTITEPVGGQHSYKPPIYGICYELIRLSPEGPVSPSSAAVKVSLVSLGEGDAPLLDLANIEKGNALTAINDGLVNVNSLFTVAVFVGLSLTTPGQHSLENRAPCDAGVDVAKKLLVFEVVSFSFFLFSSLVAQGLKLAINLLNSKDVDEAFRAHINLKVLRFGMMGSAVGSVMGCLFLMLSMVNVIEIRLGMLSCGSKSSVHAAAALVALVSSALLVYISTAVYAFLH